MRIQNLNQNGFALTLLVSLLPVLVCMTLGLFYLSAWLLPNENILHICREGLLHAEADSKKSIDSLIELNKTILVLRKSRLAAELSYSAALASGTPAAIVATKAILDSIIAAQKVILSRQLVIILEGNHALFQGLRDTRNQIQAAIDKSEHEQKSFNRVEGHLNFSFPRLLAVRKIESPDDGPPIYEIENEIRSKQALHVSWKLSEQLQKGLSKWNHLKLEKNTSCTASLELTDSKLIPVLIRDKYLWSSFF